jgi:propanediol utilization protein
MSPVTSAQAPDAAQIRIPVVISTPHVHLTAALIEELFCDRYRLHVASPLSQPAQFAAEEVVQLIGPAGRLANVRVIGPPRSENQVELSESAARALGINAPARESGDLAGTPGITIEGPRTRARLESGVIRALRHIHMGPEDAGRLHLKDHDRISVAAAAGARAPLFEQVVVRVAPGFQLELHLDIDESVAAGLCAGDSVVVSGAGGPRSR